MSDPAVICKHAPESSRQEWRLLIRCAAAELPGGDAAASNLNAEGLNWNTILALAAANRVVPLLSSAVLSEKIKGVPPQAAADLRDRFRHCARMGLAFAIELRNLLAALSQAKIHCIPLKGPVLTAGSYRKMGLREFDDLDLLVAPADVPRAVSVLAELGYSGWDIPEQRVAAHLSTECEHNLICAQRNVTVDLHWAIGRKYFTMPMDFEELWQRASRTSLLGAEVPDLSAEDAVLFLCYHGGKHLFARLAWVCDVAATIAAHPKLDWDALLARATRMGARRLLLLGLCLAQEMVHTQIPIRFRQLILSEPNLQTLVAMVLRGMMGAADANSPLKQQIESSLFHLRTRERISDRLRYLVWGAVPNARDWHGSRLPPLLSFLLVLSRPIRLLRKHCVENVAHRT